RIISAKSNFSMLLETHLLILEKISLLILNILITNFDVLLIPATCCWANVQWGRLALAGG
ncbi:MAG: hypothetical protein LBR46_01335, partial [Prevotella sp.]|nr:hypothetical protein [Prevotella sp.]